MKNLKTGIILIILGNILYILKDFFDSAASSVFSDFTQGFLLGCGVGLNVIGIILVFVYLAREGKQDKQ